MPIIARKGTLTPAGLLTCANGKLKFPFKFQQNLYPHSSVPVTTNLYCQSYPTIGDYVFCGPASGVMSAGTVGIIVRDASNDPGMAGIHDGLWEIEKLDGELDCSWKYITGVLTKDQVLEIKQYYINDGRPNRIKAGWI